MGCYLDSGSGGTIYILRTSGDYKKISEPFTKCVNHFI